MYNFGAATTPGLRPLFSKNQRTRLHFLRRIMSNFTRTRKMQHLRTGRKKVIADEKAFIKQYITLMNDSHVAQLLRNNENVFITDSKLNPTKGLSKVFYCLFIIEQHYF